MKFTDRQKIYLDKNKGLLKSGKIEEFFSGLNESEKSIFARFFYARGIDILSMFTKIPDKLFYNCEILQGITIGKKCTQIGEYAFADCVNAKGAVIPDSVEVIGRGAFKGCSSLQTVKLSNSLKIIPQDCFADCTGLQEIFIPDSVKFIKANAFKGCDNVKIYANYRKDISIKGQDVDFFKSHLRKFKQTNTQPVTESLLLEKYHESFPDWLKTGLNTYGDRVKHRLRIWDVDLNKATFHTSPNLPQKRNDPILKDPDKLVVFHVILPDKTESLVTLTSNPDKIKSLNYSSPHSRVFFDNGRKTDFRYLEDWPLRVLIDYVVDWGYLDFSDSNFKFDNLKRWSSNYNFARSPAARFDFVPDQYYTGSAHDFSNPKNRFKLKGTDLKFGPNSYLKSDNDSDLTLDKSGYIVDPHRWDKKLADVKSRKIPQYMNVLQQRLKSVQRSVLGSMSDVDFFTDDKDNELAYEMYTNLSRLSRTVRDEISNYKSLAKKVDMYAEQIQNGVSEDDSNVKLARDTLFNEFNKLSEEISQLEKSADSYKDVLADWDWMEEALRRKNKMRLSEKLFEDIENLEDADLTLNPVMERAKEWSENNQDRIDDEIDEIEKDFPKGEKVIGAEKQEVPKEPKLPKAELDESIFNEATAIMPDGTVMNKPIKYHGYKIRFDSKAETLDVYDKYGELEGWGFSSIEDAKHFIDYEVDSPFNRNDNVALHESKNYDYQNLGYINNVNCSATIFNDGTVQVSSLHPYDDSDYHWALSKDNGLNWNIYIHSPGKLVEKVKYTEDDELLDICREIADKITKLDNDSKIKSKIIHN